MICRPHVDTQQLPQSAPAFLPTFSPISPALSPIDYVLAARMDEDEDVGVDVDSSFETVVDVEVNAKITSTKSTPTAEASMEVDITPPPAPRLLSGDLPRSSPAPLRRPMISLKKGVMTNPNSLPIPECTMDEIVDSPCAEELPAVVPPVVPPTKATRPRAASSSWSRPKGRPVSGHGRRSVSASIVPPKTSSSPRVEVMQSITCTPAWSGHSFEELRTEAYAQSYIATGGPPSPVGLGGIAIPPSFGPYVSVCKEGNEHEGLGLNINFARDVVMSDMPELTSSFTFALCGSHVEP
ncbi:hypothetical protein K474DRAFT_476781 [Panus rudis PR-1116 ss-1]|nr:hypothetical protein K474DRAFT_476781 [Panus rudis PR-1116 ss-1]